MLSHAEDVLPFLKQMQQRENAIGMTVSMLASLDETRFVADSRPVVSLKTLYSDFVVRELSPFFRNGEPLVLEGKESCDLAADTEEIKDGDQQHLQPPQPDRKRARVEEQSVEEAITKIKEVFASLLSEEDMAALVQCVECGGQSVALKAVTDKESRKAVHQAVKTVLGQTHVSSTDNGNLVISKADAAARRAQERRSNASRPRKYLHFTLYKENLDTNQAFRAIADQFHMSTRQFQFSGTKDKRAVTLQRVAVRDLDPRRLASLNNRATLARGVVRVCSFKEEEHGLKLGDSVGNHFRIVLRLCQEATASREQSAPWWSASQLRAIENALSDNGVVNYYGPQRFGTTAVLTSDVGLRLLQGDYKKAIELTFASRACFVPEMKDALPLLEARRYEEAEAKVPFFCRQERDMLRRLVKSPGDYLGALQTIPRTLAMLYFHAVQSLIWNRMASRRLTSAPSAEQSRSNLETCAARVRPEVGDLVLSAVYDKRLELKCASHPLHTWSLIRESEEGGAGERTQALPATRLLTAEDDLSLFSLADVVLPVPGPDHELQFPAAAGCARSDYETEAKDLGVFDALLSGDAASSKNALLKVFHYHGTYRPLCLQPQRVQLSLVTAPSWRAVVAPTDLDKLRVREDPDKVVENSAEVAAEGESSLSSVQALVAEFSLPPGSYATSVLREFSVAVGENYHAKGDHALSDRATHEGDENAATGV